MYLIFEILGLIGTVWFFIMPILLKAPWWYYIISFIAILLVEFGCYAYVEQKYLEDMLDE